MKFWLRVEPGIVELHSGKGGSSIGTERGYIHYAIDGSTARLEYIYVSRFHRHKGMSEKLLSGFLVVIKGIASVKVISAEITSVVALKALKKVFGEPFLKIGRNAVPLEYAMRYLPRHPPEDKKGHGVTDLSRDRYVRARWMVK